MLWKSIRAGPGSTDVPGDEDGPAIDPTYVEGQPRFDIESVAFELIQIYDRVQGFEIHIHASRLHDPEFEVGRWYTEQCPFNQIGRAHV